ncbi:MAG: hypothetical protein U0794_05995 [Isosphaeraceae bacterium]
MRSTRGERPFVKVSDGRGQPVEPSARPFFPDGGRLRIETDRYTAEIATEGYVSGVAAGTFRDRATGARDLGFGLSIVDFLLEPADPKAPVAPGQYDFDNAVHGNLPKRYVEGPQICTQAKRLPVRVSLGDGFAAVRQAYRWNVGYAPHAGGSIWEQTLVFPAGERFFLSADRVTTVNASDALFFRVDLPGHVKHQAGAGFEHIYLSYHGPALIPSTEFQHNFAPDEKFLYRRGVDPLPDRFIRAYQVDSTQSGQPGPWLAGMTLEPRDVYQAWCHQRGYVRLIEELGGRPTRPGDTLGACYLIGWFDSLDTMNASHDRFRGASGLVLEGAEDRPRAYRTVTGAQLEPVRIAAPG